MQWLRRLKGVLNFALFPEKEEIYIVSTDFKTFYIIFSGIPAKKPFYKTLRLFSKSSLVSSWGGMGVTPPIPYLLYLTPPGMGIGEHPRAVSGLVGEICNYRNPVPYSLAASSLNNTDQALKRFKREVLAQGFPEGSIHVYKHDCE